MNVGDNLYIALGTATAHCAVAVSSLIAEIAEVSDKAVCIKVEVPGRDEIKPRTLSIWLPKKALIADGPATKDPVLGHYTHKTKLAHWFKPTGSQTYFFNRVVQHNIITA